MSVVIANRRDFFQPGLHPLAIRTISGDAVGQHPNDYTDIRHTHDFAELIIILGGYGVHWINGEEYPVSAGDVFLIEGNTEHYFTDRHQLKMYNIMFDAVYLRKHLDSLRRLPGYNALFLFEPSYRHHHRFQSHLHISQETLIPVESMLHNMMKETAGNAPGHDLILLARTLEIFVVLAREYSCNKNPLARSLCRLGEVISRLENEYTRPWKLAEIARIAAMAPSTLLPIFRNVTGYSPIEYLLRVRLLKAAELLIESDLSISEIAAATGFTDSNYFSRQFRQKYSVSPRRYREIFTAPKVF